MDFFVILTAGYKLVRQIKVRERSNHPIMTTIVNGEITASRMRKNHVRMNPVEIPIAPLVSIISKTCEKMIFKMVLGLAPKALMMPSSRC